jgi:glycerol uptake facilitator-like aquaporin
VNLTLLKQCSAEFIGIMALVFVGVGAIYGRFLIWEDKWFLNVGRSRPAW